MVMGYYLLRLGLCCRPLGLPMGEIFISLAFTRILGLAGGCILRQAQDDSAGLGWFGGCRVIGGLVDWCCDD